MFWSAGLPLDTQHTIFRKLWEEGVTTNLLSSPFKSVVCVYTVMTVDLRNLQGFDAVLSG